MALLHPRLASTTVLRGGFLSSYEDSQQPEDRSWLASLFSSTNYILGSPNIFFSQTWTLRSAGSFQKERTFGDHTLGTGVLIASRPFQWKSLETVFKRKIINSNISNSN